MDIALKTNAIILHRKPLREHDAAIVALTKTNGKLNLTAMGLYRPAAKLSSTLLPGNETYLTISKGKRWHITGSKISNAYAVRLVEPRLLYLSSIVRELLMELFPSEEVFSGVYQKTIECLSLLSSRQHAVATKELIVYRFILSLLDDQGLLPDFTRCSRERRALTSNEARYWRKDFGVICEACKTRNPQEIAIALPASLATVSSYTTGNVLSADERASMSQIIQDIYMNDFARPLKSLSVWQESIRVKP